MQKIKTNSINEENKLENAPKTKKEILIKYFIEKDAKK